MEVVAQSLFYLTFRNQAQWAQELGNASCFL